MDDIKKKLHTNYKTYAHYLSYYNNLSPILIDKFTPESKQLKKWLSKIHRDTKQLNQLFAPPPKSLKVSKSDHTYIIMHLMSIYDNAYSVHSTLSNVMSLLQSPHLHPINIRSSVSQTQIIEMENELRELTLIHTRLSNSWSTLEVDLIELLSRDINTILHKIDNRLTAAKFMQQTFRNSPSTIRLYAHIMQNIVDLLFGEDKSIMSQVLQLIEDDKKFCLIGPEKHSSKKNIHLTNPPISTFNLLPITESMKLSQLLSLIIPQTNGNISMEKYSSTHNVGFILLSRVTYHPIAYHIRDLLQPSDPSSNQPAEYGISSKTIKKFTNISQLTTESKWDFSSKIIRKPSTSSFYILESLDGITYRALAPWFSSDAFLVPIEKVQKLIDYLISDNHPTISSSYQSLKSLQAVNNMFIPKMMDLESLADKSTHIDMYHIQNALYENIMDVVHNNLHDHFKNGTTIQNNTHMNEIIHDPKISNKFYQVILKKYNIGSSLTNANKYSAGNFPFNELLSTYIKELRYITTRFMKELHNGYNRTPLQSNTFDMPAKKKAQLIIEKIESVVKTSVLITVHHKNNIYSDMTFKYYLLNHI